MSILAPIRQEALRVWRTMDVGSSDNRFIGRLLEVGYTLDHLTLLTLDSVGFSKTPMKLDLFRVNPLDLGFSPPEVPHKDFFSRLQDANLQLCPPEVGPLLALQYDGRVQSFMRIGMSPIHSSIFAFDSVYGRFSAIPVEAYWPILGWWIFCRPSM